MQICDVRQTGLLDKCSRISALYSFSSHKHLKSYDHITAVVILVMATKPSDQSAVFMPSCALLQTSQIRWSSTDIGAVSH